MSVRNYTLEIYPDECVGDSLGKHNYNILNLEKNLSQFNYIKNLSPEVLADIDEKFTFLNEVKESFINNKRLSQCLSTVKILEKHWKAKNIFVNFPINLSDQWKDPETRCISIEEKFEDVVLKLKKILYLKYHPSSYVENTKIHFAVPIYNTPVATPEQDYRVSKNYKSSNVDIQVSAPFSYENRTQNVNIFKKSQHITQIQTFVFKNFKNKRWILIDHISSQRHSVLPSDNRVAVDIKLTENVFNYDLYEEIITNWQDTYIPGRTNISLTIPVDVFVGSTSPLIPSLTIKNFNIGDTINIYNSGHIYGAGGNGMDGQGAYPSPISDKYTNFRPEIHDGGSAIFTGCYITLYNYGKIYGGGGGGAGGLSASSVVPPASSLSVFDPELEDLWCCYKYDIAKSRYESDLADGIIEHTPETNPFLKPVAAYSAGGAGGGGQGLNGGIPGIQGSLITSDLPQVEVKGAFPGSVSLPGSGGFGGTSQSSSSYYPDRGGTGGVFGQPGESSSSTSSPGGFGGFAITGISNVNLFVAGDIKGDLI
jgi:hypothetical protein